MTSEGRRSLVSKSPARSLLSLIKISHIFHSLSSPCPHPLSQSLMGQVAWLKVGRPKKFSVDPGGVTQALCLQHLLFPGPPLFFTYVSQSPTHPPRTFVRTGSSIFGSSSVQLHGFNIQDRTTEVQPDGYGGTEGGMRSCCCPA